MKTKEGDETCNTFEELLNNEILTQHPSETEESSEEEQQDARKRTYANVVTNPIVSPPRYHPISKETDNIIQDMKLEIQQMREQHKKEMKAMRDELQKQQGKIKQLEIMNNKVRF